MSSSPRAKIHRCRCPACERAGSWSSCARQTYVSRLRKRLPSCDTPQEPQLSTEDISALVGHTEGWIAGLQMAALSLRNREDVSRLIATFGGSHEYIVDYFAAEVLDQQPEPIKNFLLRTSILDRLYGSLCDAVTGQTDGQHTLEQLQQANLFVVSLSDDRCCYRYHHLFRDLLLKQLEQEQSRDRP